MGEYESNKNHSKGGLKEYIRKITLPLPQDQEKQGFQPNRYILFLRNFSKVIIFLLRLNGKNRFSNEFIQMLDPKIEIDISNNKKLIFRTGHGRLIWRAKTLLTEEPMIVDWIDHFEENDCFFDVGANVGNFSMYAAKRGIRTYAFEPEYFNLSLLYENIFLNNLQEKCTPIPIALGDSTNMDVFYLKSVSKGDALHSIGRKSYMIADPSHVAFKLDTLVMKLDDLIQTFKLPHPTKLKIDVDYNELQVLKGANKTLDSVKELCIEIDTKIEEHREALKFLKNKSFYEIKKESIAREWNREIANYIFAKD